MSVSIRPGATEFILICGATAADKFRTKAITAAFDVP